jgi:hypothetical protein
MEEWKYSSISQILALDTFHVPEMISRYLVGWGLEEWAKI